MFERIEKRRNHNFYDECETAEGKYKKYFYELIFTSAKIPINNCVIKRNKLRKYYNVMRDFCVLFRHKKGLYVVVYCRISLILYSLHISCFVVELSEKSLNFLLTHPSSRHAACICARVLWKCKQKRIVVTFEGNR